MKPTEGPWVLDFDLGHVHGADGEIICYLAGGPTERAKANGLRIAAAPELLEALEAVLLKLEQNRFCFEIPAEEERVRAAIRKAKGD